LTAAARLSCACPHCGGELAVTLAGLAAPAPLEPVPEEWLEPCVIAGRLGLGERYVRRLMERGLKEGHPGVRKPAGRWQGTVAAILDLRPV
jgi:hypothetical protein